jgi:hypothetical protein
LVTQPRTPPWTASQGLHRQRQPVVTGEVEVEDHHVELGHLEERLPGLEGGRRPHDREVLVVSEAHDEGINEDLVVVDDDDANGGWHSATMPRSARRLPPTGAGEPATSIG